jgi:hypothetical protein
MVRKRREIVTDDRDDPQDVLGSLADRTRYGGFFYSHEYFAPAIDVVRAAYRQREGVARNFHAAYGPLVESGYVCLHVRLTDFRTYRGGIVLPPSYYMSALDTIGSQLPTVVVSDDIDTARRGFAGLPRVLFESNDEATDFQLLRHASVVVTSNSSFAWWGAWLNERADRIVAPAGWLTPGALDDFPEKAVPPNWERVPVSVVRADSWPYPDSL